MLPSARGKALRKAKISKRVQDPNIAGVPHGEGFFPPGAEALQWERRKLMAWWRKQSAQTRAWNLEDYHTAFIATIKEQVEQGVAPWQQSWEPGARRLPEHLVSGHAYRGVNALQLSVTQTAKGYSDNRWATAAEIQALGGQVRPGEHATPVLIDAVDNERQAEQPLGAPVTGQRPGGEQDQEQNGTPMVRVHAAFNVEQADGLKLDRRDDDREQQPKWKVHQTAERVIQESGIHVAHVRGDRAFYNLQTDKVTLPERERFASANGYYQVALHELGHATGHPDRLDRNTLKQGAGNFDSVEYAREELRAEISAMLTGARVGVGHDPSRGATYVKGWLTALEHDLQEIDKAAAEAQRMSDYLMRPIRAREQAATQEHAELTKKYSAPRRPQISRMPTARPRESRPALPVGGARGPRADDRQPAGDPPPCPARRSGAGARVRSPVALSPAEDRASQLAALAALGWTGRDAEWIALVCLQSGVFTRSQFGAYFNTGEDRKPAARFVRALLDKKLGVEDARAIFPGGARAVHITHKSIYRALAVPDVRHRRGHKATTQVLMRRLLALDYVIERPTLGWLPTEAEKVQRFESLGIDRGVLPYRTYGESAPAKKRFVALKCPVAGDEKVATFTYVDPGLTTDSELRAWGVAHAPLWAALRARTFAVHVVAIGTGEGVAQRAEQVLKRWTREGDGQTETYPAGPTQADPEIRQEVARLEEAISGGNRQLLRTAGGFDKAADRLELLRKLPEGAPTRDHRRAVIDRYSIWSTVRLVSPDASLW